MHEQLAAVRETFEAVADDYDRVGVDFFRPIAAGLVAELAPRPGERVLDIGCGRGAALLPLAEAVGPTGSVTGIDLSPKMVAHAAAACEAAGLLADVRVGDAQAPDVTGPFDVVAASLVLFFLPDPEAALLLWRTLLDDGGRLGVSTFGPYSDDWRVLDDVLVAYLPPEARDPRAQAGPFTSDAGVEGLLAGAGLVDVRTVTAVVPVRFDDAEHWYRWSRSQGQRRMWMAIPEDERDAVRDRAMAQVDRCRRDDGRIGFDQTVRYTLGRRG